MNVMVQRVLPGSRKTALVTWRNLVTRWIFGFAMMLVVILGLGTSQTLVAQTTIFSDDFESGNLSSWTDDSTSHWSSSITSPVSGTYSLKHALSGVSSESFIYRNITTSDLTNNLTTWKFNLKNGSWDPSGTNDFSFLLMGDVKNPTDASLNGYIVGVNFNGSSDLLTLYRVTSGTATAIITSAFDWGSGDLVGIEVTRTPSGSWTLQYDTDGNFDNLTSAGSTTDNNHTTFNYSALYFEYTSTRAGELWLDDLSITEEVYNIKAEPSNFATGFSMVAETYQQIQFTWTDATGAVTPDRYLLMVNTSNSFTDPIDGTAQSNDTDFSDNEGEINITQGTQSYELIGLTANTTYYARLYPYTNAGSNIDFKTTGYSDTQNATTVAQEFFINEILADPSANALEGDANGDGVYGISDDEFVEILYTGSSAIDITNYTLSDDTEVKHTFPSGTIVQPNQAIVVFGGGTPTGTFGSAIVQTSGSLGLNNTGDDASLKDNNGNVVATYTFGSEGGDNQSITRDPDQTGTFVKHSLATGSSGSLFSPGTKIDGTPFYTPSVEISGSAGWRVLSSPKSEFSASDISDDTAIQGLADGANSGSTANFYVYSDNAGFEYRAPASVNTTISDGLGFLVYFYNNTNEGSSTLPITLDVSGTEPSSDVAVTLNTVTEVNSGYFSLVGNPYASNINANSITANGAGIQNNIYFWDDGEAESNAGAWITQDRTTPFIIAPWQGFYVDGADNTTTTLTIPSSAKTATAATASYFSKEVEKSPIISFEMSNGDVTSIGSRIVFNDNASKTWDLDDAALLTPLSTKFASLGFVGERRGNEVLKMIESLPSNLSESVLLPIDVQVVGSGGTFTMQWNVENLPSDWNLFLYDDQTGAKIDLKATDSFVFDLPMNSVKRSVQDIISGPIAMAVSGEPRFGLGIEPGTTTSVDEPRIVPSATVLKQNYPNPFNPSTTISLDLASASEIDLSVYDMSGRKLANLASGFRAAGSYSFTWNASDFASGMYIVQLNAGSQVFTKKMSLIK